MGFFSFRSKDTSKATVSGNRVTGVSSGDTSLEVYDNNGMYRGDINCKVVNRSSSTDVTGISLDATSVRLKYYDDRNRTLHATVSPASATNKNVIWESSDDSVVTVSSKGWLTAKNKNGTAKITAYTYDRSHSATCSVSVTAQGTLVTKIVPDSLTIKAEGGPYNFNTTSTVLGGHDSGITVSANTLGYGTTSNRTVNGFTQTFTENWGNQKTMVMTVRGNFTDDPGVTVNIIQEGSVKVKSLGFTSGTCHADGTFYHTSSSTFSGSLPFDCAIDMGQAMVDGATIDCNWIHFTGSARLNSIGANYSAAQLNEYREKHTINNKDPHFEGKVAGYDCSIRCDANTGATRTGHITFPGGKVFTITQDAAN